MNVIPLLLFILMSIFNIIACNKNKKLLITLTKITLAPLALINVIINTNLPIKMLIIVYIFYSFYLIGDIFLLSNKTILFASGLISFLLGHITLIFLFYNNKQIYFVFFIFLILLIFPEILMFKITKNGGKLKIPMQIYSIFMMLFIATSSMTLNPFFIIGTSIFTLSDSFIARNVCEKENKYNDTYIMGTYTLALILISFGFIFI
ncbi:MAG: hypothetical protein EOL97_03275 [Spirochaetia bacterium]|nr:hypothetical protein [Spirochaetia bacterium]